MKKVLLILCFLLPSFGYSQSRADVENTLDRFCEKFFSECFSGRSYKNITVSSFDVDNENQQIKAWGTVSCLNYLNLSVSQNFEATITVRSTGKVIIYFKKRSSSADGSYYWEDCEKNSEDD